jgi:hypothetical protein
LVRSEFDALIAESRWMVNFGRRMACGRLRGGSAENETYNFRSGIVRLRDADHQRGYDEQRERHSFNREGNPQRLPAPAAVS